MQEKINCIAEIPIVKDEEYGVSDAAKMAAFEEIIPKLRKERRRKIRKKSIDYVYSLVVKVLCGVNGVPEIRSMPSIANSVRQIIATSEVNYSYITKLLRISEGVKEKEEGRKEMDALKLPRYKKRSGTIKGFLQNSDLYFNDLNSGKFYPSIMNELGERDFRLGVKEKETISFVKGSLKRFRKPFFDKNDRLTINEFLDNSKSGNLIIGNDGSIRIEMVRGQHTNLAYGDKSPDLIGRNDGFSKRLVFEVCSRRGIAKSYTKEVEDKFKNSSGHISPYFELSKLKNIVESLPRETAYQRMIFNFNKKILDDDLRLHTQAMEAISAVPKDTGDYEDIHPGYYEFIFGLVEGNKPKKYTEKLKFIDMRKPDHYAGEEPINFATKEAGD